MTKLTEIYETIDFKDNYQVYISGYIGQPFLDIHEVGYIKLFYTGSGCIHYTVCMIKGKQRGASSVLYFMALDWALKHGIKDAYGLVSSDLTLSPDAIRARLNFQMRYGTYLYITPHPDFESVKIHKGDGSDWRRTATENEANMWRLKKESPFKFEYQKDGKHT